MAVVWLNAGQGAARGFFPTVGLIVSYQEQCSHLDPVRMQNMYFTTAEGALAATAILGNGQGLKVEHSVDYLRKGVWTSWLFEYISSRSP